MKYYAKQLLMSFFIGTTVLFWGLLLHFSPNEILLLALASGVLQYVIFGNHDGQA